MPSVAEYGWSSIAYYVIFSVPPFIIERVKKPSWKIAHPDEVLVDVDNNGTASPPNTGPPASGAKGSLVT
ncbi:MAG TPA: hypothetical protein VKG82_10580 [Solirubrobacteraceae bacterium]|nr:hypothetical protein [Solirubrobacteraceae bacterium]